MFSSHSLSRSPLISARFKTAATLLVCSECPRGKKLRRALKRSLAADGRKRELRIVACGCLDVCPSGGAAAVMVRAGEPARCTIIRDGATTQAALGALLHEGVGDAVSDQDR